MPLIGVIRRPVEAALYGVGVGGTQSFGVVLSRMLEVLAMLAEGGGAQKDLFDFVTPSPN